MWKHHHKPEDAVERATPPEGWDVIHKNHEWIVKMQEEGREVITDGH